MNANETIWHELTGIGNEPAPAIFPYELMPWLECLSEVCYRDNSLLNTFRKAHVHFLHKYRQPRNVERASFATSSRYDRTTEKRIRRRDNEQPIGPEIGCDWTERVVASCFHRRRDWLMRLTLDRGRSVRFSCRGRSFAISRFTSRPVRA